MEDTARTGPVNDEELMKSFMEGSEEAFDELVQRYASRITNFIHRQVCDFATAEEIAQDTFVAVYRKKHTFNLEYSFSAWFYKIAINFCRIHFRRRKSSLSTVSIEESQKDGRSSLQAALVEKGPNALEALSQKDTEEKAQRAIGELPTKHRLVFTLSFYEGMTYEEIGLLLGCSPGTVASRKHAAVKKLASKLRRLAPATAACGPRGQR